MDNDSREMSVVYKGKILIADKNRHVRDFLQREFSAEGYLVQVARDGQEILHYLNGQAPPDLLILDLEIPYLDELSLLERLEERRPPLPVIIHTFSPEETSFLPLPQAAALVEKKENPDLLKAVVADAIRKMEQDRQSV